MARTSDRTARARPEVPVDGSLDGIAAETAAPAALEADLDELRGALATHPFPTHQDDLLAHLVGHREPVRLARRVSALSRTRTYHSVDEVCDDIRQGAVAT